MKLTTYFAVATVAVAGVLAVPAHADFVYLHDDGSSEGGVGPNFGDGFVALNNFTVTGGHSVITSIDVMWITVFENPTFTAAVWSDPNQDGDPSDAVLLGTSVVTAAVAANVFETVNLTSDVNVGPNGTSFFVGVFFDSDPEYLGVSSDGGYVGPTVSWFVEYLGGASADPTDLSGPRSENRAFMIRAHADIADCNDNDVADEIDIAAGTSFDCNCNGIPDECDLDNDPSLDINGDGFIDSCVLCAGDTNCDGIVNYLDALNVLLNLGSSGPQGDTNFDGTVNFFDYIIVAWNYGLVCN